MKEERFSNLPLVHSILFYSILFYSILFYSILFYSILFYSILFYSILFYSILFYRGRCEVRIVDLRRNSIRKLITHNLLIFV